MLPSIWDCTSVYACEEVIKALYRPKCLVSHRKLDSCTRNNVAAPYSFVAIGSGGGDGGGSDGGGLCMHVHERVCMHAHICVSACSWACVHVCIQN